MTIEDRYVVDLADVTAVRFECNACGTAVSFKASDWRKVPHQCPACAASWNYGPGTPQFDTVQRFATGWNGTVSLLRNEAPFKLRLEFDRPKI